MEAWGLGGMGAWRHGGLEAWGPGGGEAGTLEIKIRVNPLHPRYPCSIKAD